MVLLLPLAAVTLLPSSGSFPAPATAWAFAAALGAVLLAARRPRWELEPEQSPWAFPASALAGCATLVVLWVGPSAGQAMRGFRVESPAADRVEAAPLLPAPPSAFFKGVNFTAERSGPYGSAVAARTLEDLAEHGVNAVALVPYAAQRPEDPELSPTHGDEPSPIRRGPARWACGCSSSRKSGCEAASSARAISLRRSRGPARWFASPLHRAAAALAHGSADVFGWAWSLVRLSKHKPSGAS